MKRWLPQTTTETCSDESRRLDLELCVQASSAFSGTMWPSPRTPCFSGREDLKANIRAGGGRGGGWPRRRTLKQPQLQGPRYRLSTSTWVWGIFHYIPAKEKGPQNKHSYYYLQNLHDNQKVYKRLYDPQLQIHLIHPFLPKLIKLPRLNATSSRKRCENVEGSLMELSEFDWFASTVRLKLVWVRIHSRLV